MKQVTQQVTSDVTFNFTATAELSDLGVPRSPVWTEFVDEELESMDIDDVSYTYDELVTYFGQHGADGLVQIGRDMLNGGDWE